MQFTNSLAIFLFAALFQWQAAFVNAAPCHAAQARDDSASGSSLPAPIAKPAGAAARPAPMPFFRPGYTKLEAAEERIYDFQNGDAADEADEQPPQAVLRASAPPPLMRLVAERRTSRY